jgi:hypothetical protein
MFRAGDMGNVRIQWGKSDDRLTAGAPKATRDGYTPDAFFYHESDDPERFVGWTGDVRQLERVFVDLIHVLPESLEFLVKVECEHKEDDPWKRYFGIAIRDHLLNLLALYRSLIYQDGTHQFCVRDYQSGEYVVIDDAGVLFVYSSRLAFRDCFLNAGFEERKESLISESTYWRQRSDEGSKLLSGFIEVAGLTPMGRDGKLYGVPH